MVDDLKIAVTGATGAVGGRVAAAIDELAPRLLVRDPRRAPRTSGEIRVCEYADHAAAVAALTGVDVLLMVSAAEAADRRDQHHSFIHAAADAGVQHVVYTSFAGASAEATFTLGRDHHDAEQAVRECSLTFTFLRDNFYADLLPHFADDQGVIRGPAGAGRLAAVARADVADAATAVLRAPTEHANATYVLSGPEALTLTEVADRAGAALRRPLRFVDQSDEEAYASRRAGYPEAADWQLDAWVSTYTAIRDGSCAQVTDDVRRVTGQPARTLEEALAEAAAWAGR